MSRVADLSLEELLALIRQTVQRLAADQPPPALQAAALLDLEPLSLGEWTGEKTFISREDFYDDEA
jgi:hypothetical protein